MRHSYILFDPMDWLVVFFFYIDIVFDRVIRERERELSVSCLIYFNFIANWLFLDVYAAAALWMS